MYRPSQVPSEQWISTVTRTFSQDETAFWLSRRHYYDFGQRRWTEASFDKSEQIQERVWQEAKYSQWTLIRLQQKADDVMNMMASMSLQSGRGVDLAPKPSIIRSGRDKLGKGNKCGKSGLTKVKVEDSRHKSRRSQIRDKIKTLPPKLALDPDFWKSVM
jgi:hypothetical protein